MTEAPPFNNDESDSLYSNLSFAFTALIALGIFFLLFRQEEPSKTAMAASASSSASNHDDDDKVILLLGVEEQLFKTCFGKDEEWLSHSCRLESLPEDCSASQLRAMLATTGSSKTKGGRSQLQAVVIQDDVEHAHWNEIKLYYKQGGFVVFFGIYGDFAAPARISKELGGGMEWKFSAYTCHEYVLTDAAQAILGSAITKQQYTKCNLLSVLPEQDRLMVPETLSLRKYVEENEADPDDDLEYFEQQVEKALESGSYERYRQRNENQCPLALHKDANHGGRFAYLGFVNGDGNIPRIVRALLSGGKTKQSAAAG